MSHPWWDKMPWDILVPASIGATLMILIQDFSDPNTWIRRFWRHMFSKFDVEQIFADPRYVNGEGQADRIILCARIRYKRKIEKGTVLIYATQNSLKKPERKLVARVEIGDKVKDEVDLKFPILVKHISRPGWTPRHDAFGVNDGNSGNVELPNSSWLTPAFSGLIELELEGQRRNLYTYAAPMRNTENTGLQVFDLQDAAFAYGNPMVKLKQSKPEIKAIENNDNS